MSRINTNVSSLIAQRSLATNQNQLNNSLQRLSTGLKINTGKDDPAGLIASENLKAEQTGIQTAIDNAGRAGNIIGTAEGGLSEVSSLLTHLQGLVGQSANTGGLSSEEIAANQLQVDSILSTVNRIAGSTSFQGRKLLDGNLAYTTSSITAADIGNVQISAARLPANAATQVVIAVSQSAQTATLGSTALPLLAGNPVTLEIGGNQGTEQVSIAGGTAIGGIITAINGVKAATGVSASNSGGALRLDSKGFGSKQYVTLNTISGTFATATGAAKAVGRDAKVSVNGAAAQADGLAVSFRNSNLDLSFDLKATQNTNAGATNFYVTGGGAQFALGSKVDETGKASIGVQGVSVGSLGDATNGYLSTLGSGQANSLSATDLSTAQKILNSAIKQVSDLRGRLGAFQKFTIGSTVNSLNVASENAAAAQSAISDTDFAAETAKLTRAQILSQAATTVLSQANSAPQSVLKLLQ